MRDYLLFVDTETSGLPKDWKKPYSKKGNWPHIVQVAWVIYTKDGNEVKAENHFINNDDFRITAASQKIHGITPELLLKNGKSRKTVMKFLSEDLQKYQPLVVGYFMQLDFHMLGVGFYRSGMENPLKELPTFCAMKASASYSHFPYRKYLGLKELYTKLFQTPLLHQHDAMVDARATARCFFELVKKGVIDDETIAQQQIPEDKAKIVGKIGILAMIFLVISILVFCLYLYFL